MSFSHPTPTPCQWFSYLAAALDRRSAVRLALVPRRQQPVPAVRHAQLTEESSTSKAGFLDAEEYGGRLRPGVAQGSMVDVGGEHPNLGRRAAGPGVGYRADQRFEPVLGRGRVISAVDAGLA